MGALAGLTADVDRGWGGIVAWVVAAGLCGLVMLIHKIVEGKIHIPSPTLAGLRWWFVKPEVGDGFGQDREPLSEGDVDLDLDDGELDEWLRENAPHCTWRILTSMGASEFGVPVKHVIERTRALGLYA